MSHHRELLEVMTLFVFLPFGGIFFMLAVIAIEDHLWGKPRKPNK